jgi:hypothetical protein
MDATRGHANASTCDPSGSPRSHVPRRSRTEVTEGLLRSSTARAHEARATDDRREHGDEAPEARGSDVREGGNASRDRPARRSEHLGMKPRAPATRGNATRSAPRRRGYPFFEPSIVGLQTSVEKTGVTAGAAPTWRRELSLRERYAPRSRGEPGDLARRASAGVSPAQSVHDPTVETVDPVAEASGRVNAGTWVSQESRAQRRDAQSCRETRRPSRGAFATRVRGDRSRLVRRRARRIAARPSVVAHRGHRHEQ